MMQLPLLHSDPNWDYIAIYTRLNEQANALIGLVLFLAQHEEATEETDNILVAKILQIDKALVETANLLSVEE